MANYLSNFITVRKKAWAEIGAIRPNYGQTRTVRWHRAVWSDTVFSKRPYQHRIVRRMKVRSRDYGQKNTAYLDKPEHITGIQLSVQRDDGERKIGGRTQANKS